MNNVKSFTDLEVYKECRKLRIAISALTKSHFPPEEKYKLTDQILRSSRSVTKLYCRRIWTILLQRKYPILPYFKRLTYGDT